MAHQNLDFQYIMKFEKQRLSKVVRDRRAAEGYTQTELAEKTGISLRSIQRIEKGEVIPRSFTINSLAAILKFTEQDLIRDRSETEALSPSRKAKKIILSTSIPPILFLLAFAFLAQSSNFPETSFEMALFWAAVVCITGVLQWIIWTHRKKTSM